MQIKISVIDFLNKMLISKDRPTCLVVLDAWTLKITSEKLSVKISEAIFWERVARWGRAFQFKVQSDLSEWEMNDNLTESKIVFERKQRDLQFRNF